MELIKKKDIPLTKHRILQLVRHAKGSFYKINAQGADCYAFTVDKVGKKHLDGTISKGNDWSGGWDWSNGIVDTNAEYIYMTVNGKFYTNV